MNVIATPMQQYCLKSLEENMTQRKGLILAGDSVMR
jgi:hypothetical protein